MTQLEKKTREVLHRNEIDFFTNYYEGHRYHPAGWRMRLERELRSLLHRAESDRLGRVLSLGCGDGQFELLLAPFAEQVVGLDLSPEAIDLAKRAAQTAGVANVHFRCMPLENLEWSETYDTVVCLATLHHVPVEDVPGLLRHVFEHLVPGGLFYSQDPNRNGLLRVTGRVLLGHSYDHFHTPDERELDPKELAEQLSEAGFESIHIGYIDLTLIPGLFVLTRGPAWPMRLMLWTDWLWCHSPFARWASGLYASAQRRR